MNSIDTSMKYLRQFAALSLLTLFVIGASGMASTTHRGSKSHAIQATVEVILQNKCTRDVKYTTKCESKTGQGVVPKGDKVKLTLEVGTTITVDGEEFMNVAASDNGQTFQVCR